ncbi:MAG: VOC family protein [Bacteroidota bacterium]
MKALKRLLINICSEKLTESRDFYISLFDFKVDYDSDWFIHLISENKKLELGIIDRNNDLVPKGFKNNPDGFYISFVVDDVGEFYELAKSKGIPMINKPENTFYGQRRLLLEDPNGVLLDVSSPIPNFKF